MAEPVQLATRSVRAEFGLQYDLHGDKNNLGLEFRTFEGDNPGAVRIVTVTGLAIRSRNFNLMERVVSCNGVHQRRRDGQGAGQGGARERRHARRF